MSFVVLVSDVGTCFIIHLLRFENTCFSMVLTKVIVHGICMEKTFLLVHNQSSEMAQCHDMMNYSDVGNTVEMIHAMKDEFMEDPISFKKFLDDIEKPLYPSCEKFTKLSALVKLYNVKARYGWSNKSISDLLQVLGDMLPVNNEMPLSMYEVKKTLNAFGMEYEKIHACPNACILYRYKFQDASSCPTSGMSRWKANKARVRNTKRMFQSPKTVKDLKWHAHGT